jgi:hypothetical protein
MSALGLQELQEAYQESGIWTMSSAATSAVVPSQPLALKSEEEIELNRMATAVYNVYAEILDVVSDPTSDEPFRRVRQHAAAYYAGRLAMPPAIRVDVVRTSDGPKIVEIDPATAISLGETEFLSKVWTERSKGSVVESQLASIAVAKARKIGANVLRILVSTGKYMYKPELSYFARAVANQGLPTEVIGPDVGDIIAGDVTKLQSNTVKQALTENPDDMAYLWLPIKEQARLRQYLYRSSKDKLPSQEQALWSTLTGLADKAWLDLLQRGNLPLELERIITLRYLDLLSAMTPSTYTNTNEIKELEPDKPLLLKPRSGMGSVGIRVASAAEAMQVAGSSEKFVFQELLDPVRDDFGPCLTAGGKIIEPENGWVSRVSVYCGPKGVEGIQVTARQASKTGFTNVHGQADAIQTAAMVV